MIDPARPEAKDAVGTAVSAGIRPLMITGDQPLTAASIAGRWGFNRAGRPESPGLRVMTGLDLESLSPEELKEAVNEVSVYARSRRSRS